MLSIVLFELDEFAWFVTDFFRPFHLNTEYFKKILIIDVFIQTISHLCYNNTLVILLVLNCFSLFLFFCHFYLNKSHAFQRCAFFDSTRRFQPNRHFGFFRLDFTVFRGCFLNETDLYKLISQIDSIAPTTIHSLDC